MADPKRIRKLAADAAAAATLQNGGDGAALVPADKGPSTPVDLDNPDTQAKILTPEPALVTVGGQPIKLHPLPALTARQFTGLFAQVLGAAQTGGRGATSTRVAGVLIEDGGLMLKFSTYAARATFEPADTPSTEDHTKEAQRIHDTAKYAELALIFDLMVTLNNVSEEFSGPKT